MELDVAKLQKIAHVGSDMNFTFGNLGFLLGQRSVLASDILHNKELDFRNPDEYKALMHNAYNQIDKQIKNLLIL